MVATEHGYRTRLGLLSAFASLYISSIYGVLVCLCYVCRCTVYICIYMYMYVFIMYRYAYIVHIMYVL